MSELRKEVEMLVSICISAVLLDRYNGVFTDARRKERELEYTSRILSLLDSSTTEFKAARKCECGGGHSFACYHCLKCNMTGEIVRPLTQKEVMEWIRDVVDWDNNEGAPMYFPTLKTGERVRIKENKK